MASHDHGRGLVAQLLGRERLPRLGVARREKQVEEVARLSRARARLTPPRHEILEKRHPAASEKAAGDIVRARDADWQDDVEQMQAGKPDTVAPHHVAQHAAVLAHLQREHGAPGDLKRQALNSREQINWPASRRPQFGHRLLGWAEHVRGEQAHGLRRERRGEGPALMSPVRPFAQRSPGRAGGAGCEVCPGAPISLVVVHEHMPDGVRRVQDEASCGQNSSAG